MKYKVRLVANEYVQKEVVEYNEVFSPVVKHTFIKILLALVAQYDLDLVHRRENYFLACDLKENIHITQSNGYKVARK